MPHTPQSIDFVLIDDVTAWLYGSQAGDASAGALDILQRMITAASVKVVKHLQCDPREQEYTEVRSGHDTPQLTLKNSPITSVTSLTINGQAVAAASTPTGGGYRFDDTELYLANGAVFPRQPACAITVVYTAGEADPIMLSDLQQGVIEWIGRRFREKERIGVSMEILNGQNVSYVLGDMPENVRSTLDSYRRVNLVA